MGDDLKMKRKHKYQLFWRMMPFLGYAFIFYMASNGFDSKQMFPAFFIVFPAFLIWMIIITLLESAIVIDTGKHFVEYMRDDK